MPRGFSRSRALWDEAQRPNAPRGALIRAILYELQPVRFSSIDVSRITTTFRSMWTGSVSFLVETVPSLIRSGYSLLTGMTTRHWMIVGGVVVYYYAVRLVHHALDAGPLLVIVTALVGIFTIGLGDTATRDGISAYSVFNRGFERILGTVDADALVQQHVGGAMGFAAAGGVAGPPPEPVVEPRLDDEPVARRRQHVDNDNNNHDENIARAVMDNVPNERGTSRKSGKKARRRNLEQRREQQRQLQAQRDAAIAMGFTENEGEEEAMAMQRLLEEQIAANNGH